MTVALGRGIYCPDPAAALRGHIVSGGWVLSTRGSQWIGHAIVSFDGSAAQSYLDIAKEGSTSWQP